MEQLNLPQYDARVRNNIGNGLQEIWDSQRRRWVKLTPEEWVRQNFVHFLINHCQYPAGRIGNEIAIKVGDLERRCDSVVFGDEAEPVMILEFKATTVTLTQEVFEQISRYNIALHVDWLVVSNGLRHFCCHLNRQANRWEFRQGLPGYPELLRPAAQP